MRRSTFSRAQYIAPLLIALGIVLVACQPHEYTATLYDTPREIEGLTLESASGGTYNPADSGAAMVVYYFGYTFCPDFCPSTLFDLNRAYGMLSEDEQSKVDVVMVSLDPERDSADVLAEYMATFNEDFIGLRTDDIDHINAVTQQFGVYYEYTDTSSDSATGYLVNHSTSLFFVDGQGRLVAVMSTGNTPEQIAGDISQLLKDM